MPDEQREMRRGPYRDDLCRSAAFELVRTDEAADGLTIEGYGAVFNAVTEINSWEGSFEEVIAPGAFKKSLRERTPKMQFDHGHHPLLGSLPLGRWTTAEEDERGLHLAGRLTDNWLVHPFRDAIADAGVDGMSFRFSVLRDEWRDKDGKPVKPDELDKLMWHGAGDRGPLRRTLREVKVSEAGPVVWPAYDETSVGVRNRTVTIDLGRLREPAERRALAEAVALADAALADAARDAAPDPDDEHTETVDAPPPDGAPSDPPKIEPQPTGQSAGTHPAGPRSTDPPAGEHSPPVPEPANPVERAQKIRREYRRRLDVLRDIPKPPDTEGSP